MCDWEFLVVRLLLFVPDLWSRDHWDRHLGSHCPLLINSYPFSPASVAQWQSVGLGIERYRVRNYFVMDEEFDQICGHITRYLHCLPHGNSPSSCVRAVPLCYGQILHSKISHNLVCTCRRAMLWRLVGNAGLLLVTWPCTSCYHGNMTMVHDKLLTHPWKTFCLKWRTEATFGSDVRTQANRNHSGHGLVGVATVQ